MRNQQIIQGQAFGSMVLVTKEMFLALLHQESNVLVVYAEPVGLNRLYSYLCSMRGITFAVRSKEKIELPSHVQALQVQSIHLPFGPMPRSVKVILFVYFGAIVTFLIAIIMAGILKNLNG